MTITLIRVVFYYIKTDNYMKTENYMKTVNYMKTEKQNTDRVSHHGNLTIEL